jgi:hypothetical protein
MGVVGLTTYIKDKSNIFFQNLDLHDTFVIIDGNAVASGLYRVGVKGYNCFGGDYDKYANYVSNFFDSLSKCNITPLIIFDGGGEDKKFRTAYNRMKKKIRAAYTATPEYQSRTALFPFLFIEVFKNIAKQKCIKIVRSIFEADNDIASIAKILDCPVISNDSDFYLFDVKYIPLETIYYGTTRIGNIFVKKCKIYKVDYLLKYLPDMDKSVLPLIAVLLGNDYTTPTISRLDFSKLMDIHKYELKNSFQQKLGEALHWLQTQTLETAIEKIISKSKQKEHKDIIKDIEMIVNGYSNIMPTMLYPLELTSKFYNKFLSLPNKSYKFECTDNLASIKVSLSNINLSYNDNLDSLHSEFEILFSENVNDIYKKVSPWLIKEINLAKFPSYFIDILYQQNIMIPVQVEDFSEPPCINISLKIIQVIFKLLISAIISDTPKTLTYIGRENFTKLTKYTLDCENTCLKNLPSLLELRNSSVNARKAILNEILRVENVFVNKFPPEWQLYIGAIKYWIDEAEEKFRTKYHIYSLLFIMLFHIIDDHIGFFCRKTLTFENKYKSFIDTYTLDENRKTKVSPPNKDKSISDALSDVYKEDCILAMPFFLSQFQFKKDIVINSRKFCVNIVHAFSLFQNCLKYILDLNALLDFPYQQTNVANLFNGTLLYNLFKKFKKHSDIDEYISILLEKSPSLLQLFISILTSVKTILPDEFVYSQNNIDKQIRKKKKLKHKIAYRNRKGKK